MTGECRRIPFRTIANAEARTPDPINIPIVGIAFMPGIAATLFWIKAGNHSIMGIMAETAVTRKMPGRVICEYL